MLNIGMSNHFGDRGKLLSFSYQIKMITVSGLPFNIFQLHVKSVMIQSSKTEKKSICGMKMYLHVKTQQHFNLTFHRLWAYSSEREQEDCADKDSWD